MQAISVIILFNFKHFKFIWLHRVPVNETYMFSVSHLKIVMAA